jgi:putative transposase
VKGALSLYYASLGELCKVFRPRGEASLPRWRAFQHSSWGKADATIILTALGVDLEGNKEVLALRACAEEDKDGWACLLQDLRSRGATHLDLIVSDGHDGLLAAVAQLFAATPRQRCLVHKQRNVLNAIPRRERGDVQAELVGIR